MELQLQFALTEEGVSGYPATVEREGWAKMKKLGNFFPVAPSYDEIRDL
jgi:hypothetical protein